MPLVPMTPALFVLAQDPFRKAVRTIPVTDVRPGDLVDTRNAVHPGPISHVFSVWASAPSVLSPFGLIHVATDDMKQYIWPTTAHVDLYGRKAG